MGMVRNFEVMLGQTLNHSVYNSVISAVLYICNPFKLFNNIRKVDEFVLSRNILLFM
jgi:sRNA-binding regulator protein Hfq